MTTDLEIQLLGGLQLRTRHISLTQFMSNKVPALLVYLAVTGKPHQRDALAALLWGEMAETDAKNNLRQALSNLRKFVDSYLTITRDTVEFNSVLPHTLDTTDFLAALQSHPNESDAVQTARLYHATTLYQGDFLAGFWVRQAPEFEEWVLRQRTRFRDLALQAFHTLTNHYLQQGNYSGAIESANRLLAFDSWREEAHYQLMMALARNGQRSAALQQYEICRRLLEEELGVEPSVELTALALRIRESLHYPMPALPAPTGGFIARKQERVLVHHRLSDPSCRLLTLSGAGGMGKTHLALEVAGTMQSYFLNGVCFVACAGVGAERSDALLYAIIHCLHLPLAGQSPPQQQLFEFLRTREMLLVLDNLEHLIEQSVWLGDLLTEAPDVKIVVTSRERLNLSGEWVVELGGLPLAPVLEPSAMEGGAEALFVASAQRVRASFTITVENAADIQRICRLVGGLPLAITLAAAWVHALSCADIANEISANLDFLTTTRRDIPLRLRSVRAVFDHSWKLLTPRQQVCFSALALFRGTFSREAAQYVTGITTHEMALLVDKSLVRRVEQGRYELHSLLRQYADHHLSDATRHRLHERHAAYFAQWLEGQEKLLSTTNEGNVFRLIQQDYENLSAYWQWAIRNQAWALAAQGLNTFRLFYSEQGRYQEGMEWLQATAGPLSSFVSANPQQHNARHLWGRVSSRWATFCLWGGQRTRAESLFQQALAVAREFEDSAELGFILLNKGYLTVLSGEYATAGTEFAESLYHYRRINNQHGVANALSALGALGNVTGAWEQARIYLEESIAISRSLQDESGLRSSLTNLGNVFYEYGDTVRARTYYEEVLPLCRKVGDRSAEAIIHCNLGSLAQQEGNLEEAETFTEKGLALFNELSSWHHIIHATASLGGIRVAQGQYRQARHDLAWALQKSIDHQLNHVSPLVIYEAAGLYDALGKAETALGCAYWVLHHPATMAEQRIGLESRIERWENAVGESRRRLIHTQAQSRSAEQMLDDLLR